MPIAFNEHPVTRWCNKKDSKYFDFASLFLLPELLPTLNTLTMKEQVVLVDRVLDIVGDYFEEYLKDKKKIAYITPDTCTDRLSSILKFYDQIATLDIAHEDIKHWDYFLFYKMDQFYEGQKIIDRLKDQPNFKTHFSKKFKQYSHMLTVHTLNEMCDSILAYSFEQFKDKIVYFSSQFERYGQKIDWNNLLTKKPNLLVAVLAVKHGHILKDKDLHNIFNDTYSYINKNGSKFNNDNLSILADTYLHLLLDNKLFIHTLAPQGDMKSAITKFLKTSYTEKSPHKAQIFANNIITGENLEYNRMKLIVAQHDNLKVLGKKFVTPEEAKQVQEIIMATKNVVKKKKI